MPTENDPVINQLTAFLSADRPATPGSNFQLLRTLQRNGSIPDPTVLLSRGIAIPLPEVMPTSLGPSKSLDYFARAYVSASAWLELPSGLQRPKPDRLRYTALAQLKGHIESIYDAFVVVRDQKESRLSPVMWAWWRMSTLLEFFVQKGEKVKALPGAASTFKPAQILDGKFRSMFWRDGMSKVYENQVLWPKSYTQLVRLWREFESSVLASPGISAEDVVAVWELAYQAEHARLDRSATAERARVQTALTAALRRLDVGLWLSDNVVTHLRLTKDATTSLS